MEKILTFFSIFLEQVFNHIVLPLFTGIGTLLDCTVLQPMRLLQLPPAIQVVVIAMLTALLSTGLRRLLEVEVKEARFRQQFALRKAAQKDLALISDWKSRESFAKAIDDEIDDDFNTYLAGRFGRHGIVYLLPVFLTLFWLDTAVIADRFVIHLPPNSLGIPGIATQLLFFIVYSTTLLFYFNRQKRLRIKSREADLESTADNISSKDSREPC